MSNEHTAHLKAQGLSDEHLARLHALHMPDKWQEIVVTVLQIVLSVLKNNPPTPPAVPTPPAESAT